MDIQFDALFAVEIFHNYYISKISKDFDIIPTALCRQQLRNYGLLFKNNEKGFAIFSEMTTDDNGHLYPRKPIEESVKFSFMLLPKNRYVLNYSNLPLQSDSNQIYYLHNLHKKPENSPVFLTAKTELSGDDRIELRPQVFQYQFDSPRSMTDIEIWDELGNLVRQERVKVIEGSCNYPIDLRQRAAGQFTLSLDGKPVSTFYAADELISRTIFGIIDIFKNDGVQKTYTINIEHRKTFWKYQVVLKYHPSILPETLSIQHPDSSSHFTQEPLNVLADQTRILPFVSSEKLALQEEPVKGIKLLKTDGNDKGTFELLGNLPNPSVTMIQPVSEEKIYSEIFVYV